MERIRRNQLRLAELLAALSLVTDLGMGQPAEEAMRACLLATDLARKMNLAEAEVASIYYTTLLKYLGCTAYAHEEAILFGGDDISLRASGTKVDFADPREALPFILLQPGRHAPLPRRILIVAYGLAQGSQFDRHMTASHCEIAAMLAQRLGLPGAVQRGLYQTMERWDGKGGPRHLAKDETVLAARFALLASRAVIFARSGGPDLAAAMLRKWAGKVFDPALVDAFLCYEPLLLRDATVDAWQAVVEAEPQPHLWISEAQLDEVAHAFADMVDLKIPFLRGHASGVAKLAEAAARTCGFSAPGVTAVRRTAFLHDLGRVGVASYPENNPRFSVQRLYLSKQELMSYYGFSNRVLWPLCHYFMAPMEHRPEFFRGYAAVNQKFARRALEAHHKRDLIWIQDYQLMLVPQLIRGGNQNTFPGIVTCLLLNPFPRAPVAVGSMEPA